MKSRSITETVISEFRIYLYHEEKSANTIEKYIRDVKAFAAYSSGADVTKDTVIAYKNKLIYDNYAVRSINSMLVALNTLFGYLNWQDCRVKLLKLQRETFRSEEKELTRPEYIRLVKVAEKSNKKISLILQTLCATGIRVSELQYITVSSVKQGRVTVMCKGKSRNIFIVKGLQKKLLEYAKASSILSGVIFVGLKGKPIDRTTVWREMKKLCHKAEVNPTKVFPHNLRHLFARVFYELERDVVKLADMLGHSSIDTTRIYTASTGAEHRRKMETMHLII